MTRPVKLGTPARKYEYSPIRLKLCVNILPDEIEALNTSDRLTLGSVEELPLSTFARCIELLAARNMTGMKTLNGLPLRRLTVESVALNQLTSVPAVTVMTAGKKPVVDISIRV